METQIFSFLEDIFKGAQEGASKSHNAGLKVSLTILIIVMWYWTNRVTRMIAEKSLSNIKVVNFIVRVVTVIFSFVYIAGLLFLWLDAEDSLVFTVLILSAVLVLAARDLFGNIVGRLVLFYKKYFKLYDRIEIDGMIGEVVKIRLFSFELMELSNWFESEKPTGRTIRVPNEKILSNAVFNYNRITDVIWTENKFTVTVDSNWQKALDIIMNTTKEYMEPMFLKNFDEEELDDIQMKIKLFNATLEQQDIVSLTQEGIELKTHYPVYYRERTKAKTILYKEILKRLEPEKDIELLGYALHVMHEDKLKIAQVE